MRRSTFMLLLLLSCAAAAKERSYSPPRLDNGQPDMQGMWIALNATPLQRPPGFSTLVIDEAQAAKLLVAVKPVSKTATPPPNRPSTSTR